MAIFITQGRFTREYIKGGLAKPEDRQAAISRLCEQAGGKLPELRYPYRFDHDVRPAAFRHAFNRTNHIGSSHCRYADCGRTWCAERERDLRRIPSAAQGIDQPA